MQTSVDLTVGYPSTTFQPYQPYRLLQDTRSRLHPSKSFEFVRRRNLLFICVAVFEFANLIDRQYLRLEHVPTTSFQKLYYLQRIATNRQSLCYFTST